jgi:Ca-activated chloride channel family protein
MQGDDRLALIKRGAQRLLERLERRDRLTILTVADQVQVLGEHSEVASGTEMPAAIDALSASGGADLGSGLARAGAIVRAHFSPTGSNSVVLCTAGTAIRAKDDQDALVATARGLARDGIALRIMAVGSDHTEDGTLEQLAHQRFGTCAFLATIPEAEQQLSAVLRAPSEVVAHAATMQVAFDPARISAYRLLGMYPAEPGARPTASVDLIDQDQVVALVELVWASDGNVANAKAVDGTAAADKRPLAEKQLVPALMTVTVQYQDRSGRPHAPIIASLADGGLRRPEQGDLPLLAAMAEFGLALRHPDDRRFSWARIQQEVRSAASADSVVTNALLDAIRRAAAVSSMPPRP